MVNVKIDVNVHQKLLQRKMETKAKSLSNVIKGLLKNKDNEREYLRSIIIKDEED